MKVAIAALAFSSAFLLVACGESTTENVTQINEMGMDVVKSVKDLPKCTANNEGEQAFVKGETSVRICVDGKWFATLASDSSAGMTCTTKQLKDNSGVKIICGGDSVGVVLNGKDGAAGKDGNDGKDGAQGIQGEKGDKGDTGADGAPGVNGKDGTNGKDGLQGEPGAAGKDGADGKDGAPGANGASCTAVTLADNSGLKVLCGGDSVGVVLNGHDGADGANGADGTNGIDGEDGSDGTNGVGCSILSKDCILHVACGADTVSLNMISSEDACHEVAEIDSEKIAISLDEVSGVTQKGPFLMGSKVLVREMEDGRTLTQTGNSFNGKIMNDKGEFKINARMLVSQYVMLEATGYYRNEVTGENSNSELTLFAITDVNDRNIVNVNLLTHLEYERVVYLVTQKKMKVKAAKKQAQKEVFALLNIDATNFSNSEDLNIAGASDEDAALLAFSIILQGDRSVSQLSELLTKIATDMETDGVWGDSLTRMTMANWAADADTSGRLTVIRNNVKMWGLSTIVPNFEKSVQFFWSNLYGLGQCQKDSLNIIKAAKYGKKAGTKTRYICVEDGDENYRWIISNDYDKDVYGWNDTTDGAIKYGNVNTERPYLFDKNHWILADSIQASLGGCTEGRFEEISKFGQTYYVCRNRNWNVAATIEYDTYKWNDTTDGSVRNGNVTKYAYVFDSIGSVNGHPGWRNAEDIEKNHGGCRAEIFGVYRWDIKNGIYCLCQESTHRWTVVSSNLIVDTQQWNDDDDGATRLGDSIGVVVPGNRICYVYDTSFAYKGWRTGNDNDCRLGLNGCTKGRAGRMGKSSFDNNYYNCADNMWSQVTDRVRYNTMGWDCLDSNNGEMKLGLVNDAYFVCDEKRWREATDGEEIACRTDGLCAACIDGLHGRFQVSNDIKYVCDTKQWRVANCAEKETESLCTANDSAIVWACEKIGNFDIDYVCTDDHWHAVVHPFEYTLKDWNLKKKTYYTASVHPNALYGDDLVDSRDNNVYKTVMIGGMRWMAENLRYADSIASVNLVGQTKCYNNQEKNCEIGGRYYSWTAAVNLDSKWLWTSATRLIGEQHRGICPEGWHLPSTEEWSMLQATCYSGNYSDCYAIGFSNWTETTDYSGFSALPVGGCDLHYNTNECYSVGDYVYYWSSSEDDGKNTGNTPYYNAGTAYLYDYMYNYKTNAYAVRCVQDDSVEP